MLSCLGGAVAIFCKITLLFNPEISIVYRKGVCLFSTIEEYIDRQSMWKRLRLKLARWKRHIPEEQPPIYGCEWLWGDINIPVLRHGLKGSSPEAVFGIPKTNNDLFKNSAANPVLKLDGRRWMNFYFKFYLSLI